MLHEIVELVKALAWPLVVVLFGFTFKTEIRALLKEIPGLFRRVRTAEGLGLKVALDELGAELTITQKEVDPLVLPAPPIPPWED
jgi:hypothetical protein